MNPEPDLNRTLRMGGNVALGCFSMFFLVGLAGLAYGCITNSLTDGFLFYIIFDWSLFVLLSSIAIGIICQRSPGFRKCCQWFVLGFIGLSVLLHLRALL
ncbi:MAG: hypothetical protein NTY98_06870 [Verrucomicrobia bacterium]|nr:hypothetical protein [Verrucomicrobiota bacterium]